MVSQLFARGNNVLNINPLNSDIDITTHASDFLWFVFCAMMASALSLLFLAYRQPLGQRSFHHLGAVICFTASIAYFCLASDLGATPIVVEWVRSGTLGDNWAKLGVNMPTRAIWYVRYIDWVITTPLLLLELLLATGLPLSEIFFTIFMDEVMIVTGLVGALVQSRYKWGLFSFGCAAEIYIWWILLGPARKSASRLGPEIQKAYLGSAAVLSFLWLLYPVAWGLADGGNVITPTGEMVFYGVLDFFAKPVFCFYHIFAVSKVDYAALAFSSGKVSDGITPGHLQATSSDPRHSTSTAIDNNATLHPKTTTAPQV